MRILNIIGYIAIPLAYLAHWLGHDRSWEPIATFLLASLGVVPLAHLMGEATEQLSERTGPTWGGLLNATFGNAAELIIGIIALTKGMNDVVKASLTGSIIGNLLLVGGAAMLVGGWRREKQTFNRHAAEANAGMLVMAVAAMLFPAMFDFTYRLHDPRYAEHERSLSVGTSVILLLVYGAGLLFTLRTHAHVFSRGPALSDEAPTGLAGIAHWSVKRSVTILLIASAGIALVAELLVGSAGTLADTLG
ncbi:MAG: calcium/proton exchanger, partial [Tepidisphaeraceae bacterium]